MHITAIPCRPMSDAWSLLQALLSWETSGPELDDLSSVAFGDPSEISHAMPHIPTNASSRLQVPPVFQQAVCLPVPPLPGAADPRHSSCPVTWSCCNVPSVWRPRPPPRQHLLPCPALQGCAPLPPVLYPPCHQAFGIFWQPCRVKYFSSLPLKVMAFHL